MTTRLAWIGFAALTGCAAPALTLPDAIAVVSANTQPARSWRPVASSAPFAAAAPLLLTDGTVMIQEIDTENWWRLTPDELGSYADGTWTPRGAMPSGYSPLYYASAVLPDGRVIVEGGEYIAGNFAFSTRGALYDPVADSWTSVDPPAGWSMIGDASGMVLPDGTFMLAACCSTQLALFDAPSETWRDTGMGKQDINDEESWAMLPDGTVLTVDTNNVDPAHPELLRQAEVYDPATGDWTSAGTTPVQISDTNIDGSGSHEIGPEVLRADGTVLALGGNSHTAIYDSTTKTWTQGPDLPTGLDIADGPAALLPNGAVLVAASPGIFNPPTSFFEFDGQSFTPVAAPPNAQFGTSYQFSMLLLPTGELLLTNFSNDVEIYTPAPGVVDAAVPVITDVPKLLTRATPRDGTAVVASAGDGVAAAERPLATLYLARSYELVGKRLSGVSQGAYYGDDEQAYTNYPLVRLTNTNTKHVAYCRTYAHSSRLVGPDTTATTRFDIPATAEPGPSTLEVVVNGIPSPALSVNVK